MPGASVRGRPPSSYPRALTWKGGCADTSLVAVDRLPDATALASELAHLRHRQADLLRQHDRLTERMLAFPNEFGLAWAKSLASEVQTMSSQIEELEAELLLVGRCARGLDADERT